MFYLRILVQVQKIYNDVPYYSFDFVLTWLYGLQITHDDSVGEEPVNRETGKKLKLG